MATPRRINASYSSFTPIKLKSRALTDCYLSLFLVSASFIFLTKIDEFDA
jgi:hypothetical protein